MGIFPTTVWEMYGKCMGNSPTTVWVASPRPYESNHVDSSLLNSYAIHTPGMGKIFSDADGPSCSKPATMTKLNPMQHYLTRSPAQGRGLIRWRFRSLSVAR